MEASNLATLKEVEFTITLKDIKASIGFVQEQNPRGKRTRYVVFLFCLGCFLPTVFLIFVAILKNQTISRLHLICVALPLLGLLIWLCEDSLVAVFLRYFGGKGKYEKRRLAITDGGLRITVGSKSLVIPWSKIEAIALNDRHAFFRFGGKGHIILPARAFADEAEFRTFVLSARQHWQEVTNRQFPAEQSSKLADTTIHLPKGGLTC